MTDSTDRLRVRRLLQMLTARTCSDHPEYPVYEVWRHVDGAMTILRDTSTLTYDERMAIVVNEYNVCHASDG